MNMTVLQPAFYGIVSATKEREAREIKVKIMDFLPNLSGEVTDEVESLEATVVTPKGEKKIKLKVGDFIPASWMNRNSNRITPPDVMKGERVLIWRDGDSQTYYWETLDIDNHLRTTEQIIFAISNTTREDLKDKTLTLDNCHFIEFNTYEKFFRIVTNKNQGEPFAYEFHLDMADGFFRFKDDKGMHALFDSTNDVIDFINHHKTHYRMDKEDILEECVGHKVMKIGKTHSVEVGEDETYKVGGASSRTVTKDETIKTANSHLTTGQFNVKSNVNNFNTPQSNFSGNVAMASFVIGAGMGATPSAGYTGDITGNFKLNGNMVGSGKIKATTGEFEGLKAGSANFGSHGPH